MSAPMSGARMLPRHSDDRGSLVAVATGEDIPFTIKRVFWIYGDTTRALAQATRTPPRPKCWCACAGSCRATLAGADGVREVSLDRPDAAVIVPPMTWLELTDFSADCVLLALADTEYLPEGVITDRRSVRTGDARDPSSSIWRPSTPRAEARSIGRSQGR